MKIPNEETTTGLFSSVPSSERPLLLTTPTGEVPSKPSVLIQKRSPKSKGFKPLIEVVSSSDEPVEGQRSNGDHSNVTEVKIGQWAEPVICVESVGKKNEQPLLIEEIEESDESMMR